MKKTFHSLLATLLLFVCIACSSEQIKKVGSAMGEILPEVLSSITMAYGGGYSSIIGNFFKIITGADLPEQAPADSGYAQETVGESSPDSPYYVGQAPETGTQDQGYYGQQPSEDPGYYQGQPQQDSGYYETQPQGGQEYYQEQPQTDQGYYQPQPQQSQPQISYGASGTPQSYGVGLKPLEVRIDVVKEVFANGRYQAAPVVDGDVLTQQDNYKILFKTNLPCFMYIAQLDATGKMDPITPGKFSSYRNPTRPGLLYDIPAGIEWFYLDANRGVETIYFIASRTSRPDIEQLFQQLEATNQNLIQQNQVSIQQTYVVTRGIGGKRPGGSQPVNLQNGTQGSYASTLFQSIQADFVMTRWFHHQ